MTTHKVDELDGAALNIAVAIAAGREWRIHETYGFQVHEVPTRGGASYWTTFHPSMSWSDAGPLIEAECIALSPPTSPVHRNGGPNAGNGISGIWGATTWHKGANGRRAIAHHATSPLIAAMRCYVASKLDDTVELP